MTIETSDTSLADQRKEIQIETQLNNGQLILAHKFNITFTTETCETINPSVVEGSFYNETIIFERDIQNFRRVKLPSLDISPTNCNFTITWSTIRISDGLDMMLEMPSVFYINGPNLILTNEIQSIRGLYQFYLIAQLNDFWTSYTSKFYFTVDFQDACMKINEKESKTIDNMIATQPLQLSLPAHNVDYTIDSYKSQFSQIQTALIRADNRRKQCVLDQLVIIFEPAPDEDLLKHSPEDQSISLYSTIDSEVGFKDDSKLLFQINGFEWTLPIEVSYIPCKVKNLSIVPQAIIETYRIGMEAILMPLPAIKEEPPCGGSFSDFEITSWTSNNITEAQFSAAITLDP